MAHVSPSQIVTFQRCARKWGFSRISERSVTPATKFGTKVHEILENWLLNKALPSPNTPEGRCALAGIQHLPMPRTDGLEIELGLDMEHDGVQYIGRIDFVHATSEGIVVGDHKTTKNLDYAKTEEELLHDPQRIIYSHYIAQTYGVAEVTATWVYYQRFPPESKVVSFTEDAYRIEDRFEALHERVSLPIVQSQGVDPMELEPNYDACTDFGRCPYWDKCHSAPRAKSSLSEMVCATIKQSEDS